MGPLIPSRVIYLVLVICALSRADVYLHIPRGSNNRLTEESDNRANANRCFDSQNNNRGGYNVGDKTDQKSADEDGQYQMKYFQSGAVEAEASFLYVEWTSQHACRSLQDGSGDSPHLTNCDHVLQYMCQPEDYQPSDPGQCKIRNGKSTGTPDFKSFQIRGDTRENYAAFKGRHQNQEDRCCQEPFEWYDSCNMRERNKGLETLDQVPRTPGARYTRQNPKGTRRGYECPEERDYYPYWHPTPWRDAAVLVGHTKSQTCRDFTEQSHNVAGYHECIEFWPDDQQRRQHYSRWNNQEDCEEHDGKWTQLFSFLEKATDLKTQEACEGKTDGGFGVSYIWEIPSDTPDGTTKECLVAPAAPVCKPARYTRDNHLGNAAANGKDGKDAVPQTLSYKWRLPHFPSGKAQNCVFRLRYNISTSDNMNALTQNPKGELVEGVELKLAINTAQYGRTFQDRSHRFTLAARPDGMCAGAPIHNVNVRGVRGNIVQAFPAVEYDFVPTHLKAAENECIHYQWTGSNSNPKNRAGQGKDKTDRSNIVQIYDFALNYPMAFNLSERGYISANNAGAGCMYYYSRNVRLADAIKNCAGLAFQGREFELLSFPKSKAKDLVTEMCAPFKNQNNKPQWYYKELWVVDVNEGPGYVMKCPDQVNDKNVNNHHPALCSLKSPDTCNVDQVENPVEVESMWENMSVVWPDTDLTPEDLKVKLGTSCKFSKASEVEAGELQNELDNAPASCEGVVVKMKAGKYYYMCSRNNNFTNRSQKGTITISGEKDDTKK